MERPADPAQNKPDLGPQFHDVGLSMRGTCQASAWVFHNVSEPLPPHFGSVVTQSIATEAGITLPSLSRHRPG